MLLLVSAESGSVVSPLLLILWRPVLPYGYSYKASCVPDRVKPPFVIFWHPGTLTLRAERQSARMSKNYKWWLNPVYKLGLTSQSQRRRPVEFLPEPVSLGLSTLSDGFLKLFERQHWQSQCNNTLSISCSCLPTVTIKNVQVSWEKNDKCEIDENWAHAKRFVVFSTSIHYKQICLGYQI